jgi:Fic family protein
LIREIHAVLMAGLRGGRLTPGELRTSQNWIGPTGATPSTATFVPPPPHKVPQALADLETFLHSDSGLPPLIQVGLAHARFETIHPFLDGNGRPGRLLITFLLTEKRLLRKPVLYLSHYFKRHRAGYYDRPQAMRDAGDWEGWLEFFLRGVAEVSAGATATAAAIPRMREDYRDRITEHLDPAAANGHRGMDHLFDHPITRWPPCATGSGYPRWRKQDRQPPRSNRPASRNHRPRAQPAVSFRTVPRAIRGTGGSATVNTLQLFWRNV